MIAKLLSQRGATDKILVTLLLVILSVVAMSSMGTWFHNEVNEAQNVVDQSVQNATPQ